MKTSTLSTPSNTSACKPPTMSAEPTRPPIRAWLLDDGRPSHQVTRSHTIAPTRPARITYTVENSGWIMPLPTVAATAVPNTNGPAKLATAAMPTACSGRSTLVPTTVAIEFAAS